MITAQGEAVYFSGRTGRYLEPPTGTPNVNVLNMARDGLRLPLRTALHQAVTTHQRVVQEQVPVQTNGDVQPITLVVQPLTEPGDDVPLYLVIFQDVGPAESTAPRRGGRAAVRPGGRTSSAPWKHELRATRERLQTTIEELETTNEELSPPMRSFSPPTRSSKRRKRNSSPSTRNWRR